MTRSDSTVSQSRSCGQSGAPSAIDHGRADGAGADDGPRAHDPAHVGGEEDAVAAVHVGLVRDLARDRDEKAAVDVQRALGPAGRAGRVSEEVRSLRVDLQRLERSGLFRHELRPAALAAPRRARSRRRRSPVRASPACRCACRGGSDQSAQMTAFASESSSRAAIAGAAKPEKTGTCTAPMCAQACDATATAGLIGRKMRDAVALAHAELDERLRDLRHLARQLAPGQRRARAVLAAEHGGLARQVAPAMDAVRGDVQPRADEPRRPLGPARDIDDALPRLRELEAEIVDQRGPEALRLLDRDAMQFVVVGTTQAPHQARDVRALDALRDWVTRRRRSPKVVPSV